MSLPAWARRILREPLTHFLVIGALLFAGVQAAQAFRKPVVRIDPADVEQLVTYWQAQMERPPTKAELDAIIQDRIDEELLAREAVRLGLDKDDMIVRRRLAQKMAFTTEDGAAAEPTETALRAWYGRHKEAYVQPTRVALRHVFVSGDRPDAEARARQALAALRRGEDAGGDPFVLPLAFADVTLMDLARDFGPDFAKAVSEAPVGSWAGPAPSGYGLHLVKVEQRLAAQPQAFEAVRAQVREAYIAERRAKAQDAFLAELRQRYRIEVSGVAP